jgi:uncharacterized membrane protein
LNLENWFNFLENHWIIVLICILILIFTIDVIQLIISRLRSNLSKEQQLQLKEISRLRRNIKFGKPPEL